jgi:hypothetical protein
MRKMPVVRSGLFGVGAALLLAGCATGRGPVEWDLARLSEIAEKVESDPQLAHREDALFQAGLAHALPHSPLFDPARARDRFERLLRDHPRSRHRGVITYLLPLLDASDALRLDLARRLTEVEELREEAEELREQMMELERTSREEASENALMRVRLERLEAAIRTRDARIRALEEQLQGLVRIDLRSPG